MAELRRREFAVDDAAAVHALLDRATHAFLAFLAPSNQPGIVAVNIVRCDDALYFHGAREGEKAAALAPGVPVALMVAEPLALIPSYWLHPELACPATQFFRSVVVHGGIRPVNEAEEKAKALQALMEKLQPEGGHAPIEDDLRYRRGLETTAVYALSLEGATAKFKLGQNLPRRTRVNLVRRLLERGSPVDLATVEAMAEHGLVRSPTAPRSAPQSTAPPPQAAALADPPIGAPPPRPG